MKSPNWPLVLGAPLLLAVGLWYLQNASPALRGDERLPLLAAPIVIAALSSIVALVIWRKPAEPAAPVRWLLVALAFAVQAAGFALLLQRDQSLALRLPGDVSGELRQRMEAAFFLAQPLLVLAFAAFPRSAGGRRARSRYLVDATLIVVSGALVFWAASGSPIAPARVRPVWLAVTYVTLDLLILFTLVTQMLRIPPPHRCWRGLLAMAVGMGLILFTDSWGAHQPASAALRGGLTHVRFLLGQLVMLGGLLYLAGLRGGPEPYREEDEEKPTGVSIVSFGALTAGYALLAIVAFRSESRLVTVLTIGAAVITFMVVLRQLSAWRESLRHERTVAQREAETRFHTLVANASDTITVLSREGEVIYASPSAPRLFGVLPAELVGRPLEALLHPDEGATARAFLQELLAKPWSSATQTWRLLRHDGAWAWGETTATNLLDDPNVGGLVLNTRDVSERRELEQRLTHQAMHDGLTGLPNRVMLRNRLEQVLRQAPRPGIGPTLFFLDLDGFKSVNDTLGHAQGDAMLVAAATRLRETLPDADVIARLGGDEFAALLAAPPDRQVVLDAAQRVTNAFKAPFRVFGREVPGSASLGVAIAGPADTAGDVLRHADVAMYLAKSNGRARFEVFEQRMLEAVVGRLGLQSDLRRALAREDTDEFYLDYQPIVELATGKPVGLEALLRWDHPEQGRITPAVFIPLAEETGLIVPLGRRALQLACQDAAPWMACHQALHVTVNLSARQIPDPGLVTEVRMALAESGMPPASLVLELTESAIMQQPERSASVLRELRDLGVQLAIDDFGTGYSSLSYLQQLPATILKIDRSFLDGLRGKDGRTLVRGIVGLANGLSLTTVAEGIEQAGQADALRQLGCLCGQGLYFSPPLPAREVPAWLAERLGRSVGAI
ncbi:MAG TPA: EAL domain-containing protein [Gemmatimonadales bacterium]|nr:EAL domain-containing protein [Gemmatimonadales bacterium]